MICPKCNIEGKNSIVTSHGSSSTLAGYTTWHDEEGNLHHHDRNTVTTIYSCSNGHEFVSKRKGLPCPSYPNNCDFNGGEEELIVKLNQ